LIELAIINAARETPGKTPLLPDVPHVLLPTLGKPLLIRSVEPLYRAGIRRFVILLGLRETAASSQLNRRWLPDAELEFVFKPDEQPLPAKLIEMAQQYQRPFLLTRYDVFAHDQCLTTMLRQHEDQPDHLILAAARELLTQVESNHPSVKETNTGLRVVADDPDAEQLIELALCGQQFVDWLRDTRPSTGSFFGLVQDWLHAHVDATTLTRTSWSIQVNDESDLLRLNRHLLAEGRDTHILAELPTSVRIIPPVRIDPMVSVGHNAVIGPNVYLERGTRIGMNAQVQDSLVLDRGVIANGEHVRASVITRSGRLNAR